MIVSEGAESIAPASMISSQRNLARAVVLAMVLIGGGVLIWGTWDALAPYVLGLTIAYLLLPLVTTIERVIPAKGRLAGARRTIATLITFLIVLAAIVGLAALLVRPIVDQTEALFNSLGTYWNHILEKYPTFRGWYNDVVPDEIKAWVRDHLDNVGKVLLGAAVSVLGTLISASGSVIGGFLSLVMIPLFIVYFLIDLGTLNRRLRHQMPTSWAEDAVAVGTIINRTLGSYSRGVIVEAVIVGAITGFGYWVIGVKLWAALAVIAFAGEIVPILGPWIAFFISFPVVLATQPSRAIPAIALFAVIQLLEGWILAPRIQGHSVDFSASATLVILAIGTALGGGLGVVVALPTAALIRAFIVYAVQRLSGDRPTAALESVLFRGQETSPDAARPPGQTA